MKNIPKILSPAGDKKSLQAAIAAGADAVYFGGSCFNARMLAENFSQNDIKDAINFCHYHNAEAHITFNTQLYTKELKDALLYAEFLYTAGADMLIVADLGLGELIHKYFPDFPLCASTQTSVQNIDDAEIFKKMGFSQMVLPRELSFDDIKKISENSPIKTEIFVHGAHCVSFSGQCLMSYIIGGRSGNRGECAQPCRQKYIGNNNAYPLSLKDMCLAENIEKICQSGVDMLKIEGRMKSPEYVYTTTKIYRTLLDSQKNATPNDMKALSDIFSRSGFSDGYFKGKTDKKMLGIRTPADKEKTDKAASVAAKELQNTIKAKNIVYPLPSDIEIPHLDRESVKQSYAVEKNTERAEKIPEKTAYFNKAVQIPENADKYFSKIFLDICEFEKGVNIPKCVNGIALPTIIFNSDIEKIKPIMAKAQKMGIKNALVSHISHITLCEGMTVYGNIGLNVFNTQTQKLYYKYGFDKVIFSPELKKPQINAMADKNSGAVVYGRLPVMNMVKCVMKDAFDNVGESCSACKGKSLNITDKTGAKFTVLKTFAHRNILLNSYPIYMADVIDSIGVSLHHYIFTTETKEQVGKIVNSYKTKARPEGKFRRI